LIWAFLFPNNNYIIEKAKLFHQKKGGESMPQNVTRQRPCPICGKPDMCFSDIRQDGVKVTVCGRTQQDMVNGHDGRLYKMLPKKAVTNYTIYVDYEDDLIRSEERRRQWCIEHGYRYKPKEGVILPSVLSPVDEKWEYDKEIIQPLPHKILDAIIRPWMEEDLILSDFHHNKLMMEWGKNPKAAAEIFSTWPIRTMPAEDLWRKEVPAFYKGRGEGPLRVELMRRLIRRCKEAGLDSPQGIPGVCQDQDGNWKFAARSGILYPVYNHRGLLYRLRIGTDYPDVKGMLDGQDGVFHFWRDSWYFNREGKPKEEKGVLAWRHGSKINRIMLTAKGLPEGKPSGKYINMSSFKEWRDMERHVIVNQYKGGCQAGSSISVYRPLSGRPGIFWITEGEKKAMSISVILGVTVICVPGVNTFSRLFQSVEGGMSTIEAMWDEGMRIAVVAFDADKEVNEMVRDAESKLLVKLGDAGFKTGKTRWNKAFGKGLDDSLFMGARPSIEMVQT